MEILTTDGWHIYELDYSEFLKQKDNRADWLFEELKREYSIAYEKLPDPYEKMREELYEYMRIKEREVFEHTVSARDGQRKKLFYEHQKKIDDYHQNYLSEDFDN